MPDHASISAGISEVPRQLLPLDQPLVAALIPHSTTSSKVSSKRVVGEWAPCRDAHGLARRAAVAVDGGPRLLALQHGSLRGSLL
jgi:hypothetical protein